jgi:shikimate kinase
MEKNMNHIILIGFMGSGKSTVGKALAKDLNIPFIDTDEKIEKETGRIINDIFRESGEAYFRDLETEALKDLLKKKERQVIAVGGSLPVRKENRDYLKQLGKVIYLTASVSTLVERLSGDATRPMLQGDDLKKRIETLMEQRGALYDEAADVEVATDGKTLREVIEEIKDDVG